MDYVYPKPVTKIIILTFALGLAGCGTPQPPPYTKAGATAEQLKKDDIICDALAERRAKRENPPLVYMGTVIDSNITKQITAHHKYYSECMNKKGYEYDRGVTGQQTILIVEDDPQNLDLLEVYMKEIQGATIVTATNALEAMDRVSKDTPSLILLDVMASKTSSFEVCEQVKSSSNTRDTIIIMIIAKNEASDIDRAAECGSDEYIIKPLERNRIIYLVRQQMKSGAYY